MELGGIVRAALGRWLLGYKLEYSERKREREEY
jgi:hypothetical protein